MLHSFRVPLEIECADVASEAMTCKNKMFNSDTFPPLLNSLNVVVSCLFPGHFVMPGASGRETHAVGIEGVDLEVVFEMLE